MPNLRMDLAFTPSECTVKQCTTKHPRFPSYALSLWNPYLLQVSRARFRARPNPTITSTSRLENRGGSFAFHEKGYGPVIDQANFHVGLEDALLDTDSVLADLVAKGKVK
jgi:hypothetical protein